METLLPLGFAVLGAEVMRQSLTRMTFYNYERGAPGPGFLPFWLSLGVVFLGLSLAVREAVALGAEEEGVSWPDASGWRRIGAVLGLFGVALLVLEWFGFIPTTIVYVGLVAYGLGLRAPKVVVPVSLSVGLVLYGLFSLWLRVPLPKGIFDL